VKILTIENILKFASFRNKYDLLSNNVARKIFDSIKEKYLNRINTNGSFFEKDEDCKEYTIDFFVKFIDSTDMKREVKARFYYPEGKTEPFIDIRILIGLNFSKQDFERLYWHLYEFIRHEYEHFDGYKKGLWPDEEYIKTMLSLDKMNLSDVERIKLVSKYILDPIEIDSYAKSIMYVAKKRKTPYGQVVQDVLNRVLFNNDENIKNRMTQNQAINTIINGIEKRLVDRIKEVFPSVVLKDSF